MRAGVSLPNARSKYSEPHTTNPRPGGDPPVRSTALLSGMSLQPGTLRAVLIDRLKRSLGKDPDTATQRDIYDALSMAVREELAERWIATQRRVAQAARQARLLPVVEFLLGRSLINALVEPRRRPGATRRAPRWPSSATTSTRVAEEETTPASATAASAASPPASSIRWRRWSCRGRLRHPLRLRHLHAGRSTRTAASARSPSSWLRLDNLWEIPRATRATSSASAAAA